MKFISGNYGGECYEVNGNKIILYRHSCEKLYQVLLKPEKTKRMA